MATLQPWQMRYGYIVDANDVVVDEVTVVAMPAGQSYTGLEQVEIFCHGGTVISRRIQELCVRHGARPAEPGEFTRLAFENGRIDLAKAEAVAELIAARTDAAYRAGRDHLLGSYTDHINQLRDRLRRLLAELEAGIDFTEEGVYALSDSELQQLTVDVAHDVSVFAATYRGGQILRDGFRVVVAGRPNAGKSSLFNRLLSRERALVTPTAGTTRDYLSEWIDIDGFAVELIDTAGLRRDGDDPIEILGQERARELIDTSHLVIWLVDRSDKSAIESLHHDIQPLSETPHVVVGNKSDLESLHPAERIDLTVSCHTGDGLEDLRRMLAARIHEHVPDSEDGLIVTSARHYAKLTTAHEALMRVESLFVSGESTEVIAVEIREAIQAVEEITGEVTTEEILGEIFATFCVGK